MSAGDDRRLLVVVTGPTASGKTSLAIEIAEHFGTEIVSGGIVQCRTVRNGCSGHSERNMEPQAGGGCVRRLDDVCRRIVQGYG